MNTDTIIDTITGIRNNAPPAVEATVHLFFGDLLGPLRNATARSGTDPVPFLLFALANDPDATADNLADLWRVEYPHPVDHAMIEIVLAAAARQRNDWLLRKRTKRAMKKAGMI